MIEYFNAYKVIKYYILFWFFKWICLTAYKISQISDERSRICELLYMQNKKIFASQAIVLLNNQAIDCIRENNTQNNALLLARLSALHNSTSD